MPILGARGCENCMCTYRRENLKLYNLGEILYGWNVVKHFPSYLSLHYEKLSMDDFSKIHILK